MPLLYEGRDVVGLAQTGTGKTLAFGDPLARSIDPSRNEVQALILLPTRELCDQVTDVMAHLGDFYRFTTIRLVGGKPINRDLEALERGGHVIVGTPGRVIDHLKRRTLSLSRARFVVLDEADEMLDIGFAKDIDQILRQAPLDRQTALFSATMPMSISRLVWRYMRDSERVEASPAQLQPVDTVRQLYCEVASRDKFHALEHLHDSMDLGRSLIFRRTKVGVDRLTAGLRRDGIHARAIHGDLRQAERDRVMKDFRSGKLEWLVATNVAAPRARHSRHRARRQLRRAAERRGVHPPRGAHGASGQGRLGDHVRGRVGAGGVGSDPGPRRGRGPGAPRHPDPLRLAKRGRALSPRRPRRRWRRWGRSRRRPRPRSRSSSSSGNSTRMSGQPCESALKMLGCR